MSGVGIPEGVRHSFQIAIDFSWFSAARGRMFDSPAAGRRGLYRHVVLHGEAGMLLQFSNEAICHS